VKVIAGIMFGMPGETREEVRQTVALIDEIQPDWVDPAFFTPYPGTTLHEYCERKGLLIEQGYKGYLRDPGSSAKIKGVDYDFILRTLGPRYGARERWARG
jgi:radical SAM superfamily enzyme YgiQ (UPF0313 family)